MEEVEEEEQSSDRAPAMPEKSHLAHGARLREVAGSSCWRRPSDQTG